MIILLLLSASILMAATNLPDFSAYLAEPFQRICFSLSPAYTEMKELYTATVCGITPDNTELMWDFRNTGLYHLIVVSGAHLSFLASLLMLAKTPSRILICLLCIYALMSGLNPPIVRALAGLAVMKLQKKNYWGWSAPTVVLVSGLACLIIFPSWWKSLSFLMSWLASFAIVMPGSLLRKSFYCYLVLLLPMSAFQWNHPLTVVFNLLLAPILGFLVLPFSLLPFFIPPFIFMSDWVWMAIIWIVRLCSGLVTSTQPMIHFALWFTWASLFGLHYVVHRWRVQFRRAEWRPS